MKCTYDLSRGVVVATPQKVAISCFIWHAYSTPETTVAIGCLVLKLQGLEHI